VQCDLCFPDTNRPQINRAGGCPPKRIANDNPVYLSRSEIDTVTNRNRFYFGNQVVTQNRSKTVFHLNINKNKTTDFNDEGNLSMLG